MITPQSLLIILFMSYVLLMKNVKSNNKTRSITLKQDTYERLEKFKVDLIGQKKDPNLSFSDAVAQLLDEKEKKVIR